MLRCLYGTPSILLKSKRTCHVWTILHPKQSLKEGFVGLAEKIAFLLQTTFLLKQDLFVHKIVTVILNFHSEDT